MKKRFLTIFEKNKTHDISPPLWMMRQAGRYLPEYKKIRQSVSSFLELCYTPKLACEVTLQPIERFGFDAAILFSDILVIPDALGSDVVFEPNHGPKLSIIQNEEDLKSLSLHHIESHLSPVFEAITLIRSKLSKETALIGFAGSPWTVATYMVEGGSSKQFANILHLLHHNPPLFRELIDLITEATQLYLSKQIEAGVEVIQLFDSWSGVLSASGFEEYVITPTQKIVSFLKHHYPHIPIIGFPKSCGVNILPYIDNVKTNGVSIDASFPLDWVKENLQKERNIVVQGNLDPYLLVEGGERLTLQVEKILSSLSGNPFIFNLGHGILPHTPIAHVEALVKQVREWK